jgi:hypothetical protein
LRRSIDLSASWSTGRPVTQRHGAYGMIFDHYAPIPGPDDDEPFPPAVGMRA